MNLILIPTGFIVMCYLLYKVHEMGKVEKEMLANLRGIQLQLQYLRRKE